MRLFVGLAPPAAALDDLDAACAPFRLARDDLRWTSRELWHVTLAFLGEVSEETLARLAPRLERAAGRHRAFTLSVAGAGAFPKPARANVLWSGMSGDRRALADLAADRVGRRPQGRRHAAGRRPRVHPAPDPRPLPRPGRRARDRRHASTATGDRTGPLRRST